MEPVTSLALKAFLQKLGELILQPVTLYLLGGSALCLLGRFLSDRPAGCPTRRY
jgi:hypothetical protein